MAIGRCCEERKRIKWNQDQIPFSNIIKMLAKNGYKPILGDKRSKTKWSVFIK